MTSALFVTQAKSIQSFILASDKLRDMVGATELVEQISDLLEKTIAALAPANHHEVLTKAAGVVRVWFADENDALALAQVWPMVCAHALPGLDVIQTVQPSPSSDYLQAVNNAETSLASAKNLRTPLLPLPTPPVARTQRTGNAAVTSDRLPENEREDIDACLYAKRLCRNASQGTSSIFQRIGLDTEGWETPKDFDGISGKERSYLGILHADGNGLGKLLIALSNHFQKLKPDPDIVKNFYRDLSETIKEITREALVSAWDSMLASLDQPALPTKKQILPALPIVLAGDDVTFLFRADLAAPFAANFLAKFSEISETLLASLSEKFSSLHLGDIDSPEQIRRFSAGAGIVFCKPGFPFSHAYALCESLAKHAKNHAKSLAKKNQTPVLPAFSFHQISASGSAREFLDILDTELAGDTFQKSPISLSCSPYYLETGGTALYRNLETLIDSLQHFPKGPPRELYSLLQTDWARAEKHYQRMLEINPKNAPKLKASFALFTGSPSSPFSKDPDHPASPLGDALTLLSFRPKKS